MCSDCQLRWFVLPLFLGVLTPLPGPVRAWGPHTEITAAGLAVLPDGDKTRACLGEDFARLSRDYTAGSPGDICRPVAVTYKK